MLLLVINHRNLKEGQDSAMGLLNRPNQDIYTAQCMYVGFAAQCMYVGFAAGVANKVGVCNQFNGRDTTICFNGQTNGFNRNFGVWEQTDIYKIGFK